ncbi:catechol 1,2-dioxygenase, partial [Lacticaseibacillus rhamnosus]
DDKEGYMRGISPSRPDGTYLVETVAPIGYTIPLDGTVGELFSHTNISPYRPAHIHFMLTVPGHHRVTTHLFQKGDQYIDTDVVYGVKEPLIRVAR